MNDRRRFTYKIAVPTLAIGLVSAASASFSACSSSSATSDDAGTPVTDAGTSSVSTTQGSCATPTVGISFSPMYSAHIPGSTAHSFQIPSVTSDGTAAVWSVSDPSQVQLAAQDFDGVPGVMITVQGSGPNGALTVYATKSDGSCGAATLNITAATEDDWQIGNSRYNDGVALHLGGPGGGNDGGRPDGGGPGKGGGRPTQDGGSFFEVDGGTACTNCHGPTATGGPFSDVSHTPEQTGGFSDDQLIEIIINGNIPDGGYFDPTVINSNCDGGAKCTASAYNTWHSFHRWSDIQSDQYKGIVTYLRSLQPASQAGKSNFGGGGRRDGGPGGPGGGPGGGGAVPDGG